MKASSCWAASFLTANKELNTSEPCHRDFDDTSRGQENLNNVRLKEGQMHSEGEDQGSERAVNGHGKWEELGRLEQDNHLGLNGHV